MVHETAITVAADHPAFDGHFPGAPVLPGAMLLALVIDALPAPARATLAQPVTLQQLKFLQPVRPGALLTLRCTLDAPQGLPFEVLQRADAHHGSSAALVAKGVLARLPRDRSAGERAELG